MSVIRIENIATIVYYLKRCKKRNEENILVKELKLLTKSFMRLISNLLKDYRHLVIMVNVC